MQILNEELISLVRETSFRATPADTERIRLILNTMQHSGLVADSESTSSLRLQALLASHATVLTAESQEKARNVQLFGLELPLCDAFPKRHQGRECIFVHDGLLQLLRYYADLTNMMSLLQGVPGPTVTVNGEATPLDLAFSLAGHAACVASIESGYQLVDISMLMGPVAKQRAEHGYGAAALFFLLHELGHHVCGHLESGYVSERSALETRLPESLNPFQTMELEADAFALDCFIPSIRGPVISSIVFALGPFAFLETFSGSANASHPLTVNRLAHLADQVSVPDEPSMEATIRSVVEAKVKQFRQLAKQRAASGGDIRSRIYDSMPIEHAYAVLGQVGEWVQGKYGTLDFEPD